MIVAWVVILLLIAMTAFYVAAEFAAVSARRSRIQQLAEEDNILAKRLMPYLEDPHALDRYIAACQVGITVGSLLLGAYGQAAFSESLASMLSMAFGMATVAAQRAASIVVLIGLTILAMVLGELVPKSVALRFPTQVALYTVIPMQWSLTVFSSFIRVLNGSGNALLKLMRAPLAGHRHIHSPDEIELLIAESRDGGLLEPDEHHRLRRALKLGIRTVRQLMVPRVKMTAIEIDTPIKDVLAKLSSCPYTRLPVYRETVDHIVGVLNTKDLVLRYVEQGAPPKIEQVMRPILQVPENLTVDRLLALMREKKSQVAVAIDEFGGVVGLVTVEDVLSEVLGHVADEFKSEEPQPERMPDGRVRLPGLMRLDEAEPWIGVLWDGEADTVAGRVIEALGSLPSPGDTVTIDGVEVEVEKMENRAVASILARPLSKGEEEARE